MAISPYVSLRKAKSAGWFSENGLRHGITEDSYEGHIAKAAESNFPLCAEIPLTPELGESVTWIINTPGNETLTFWESHISRRWIMVRLSEPRQRELNEITPPNSRRLRGKYNRWISPNYSPTSA